MSCNCKTVEKSIGEGERFVIPFALSKGEKDDKGRYTIYIKASSEDIDQQDERVLMKALQDQTPFFLSNGIVDWDHFSKRDRANADKYIIGEPLEVGFEKASKTTFVKAWLYEGIEKSEHVKKLLDAGSTRLGASIGGGIFQKAQAFDKAAGRKISTIMKARWDHIAITPTTQAVLLGTQVTKMPIGVFAKSLSRLICANGQCIWSDADEAQFVKALEAGAETDSAKISGGQAIQRQSLEGKIRRVMARHKKGKIKTLKEWKKALDEESIDRSLHAPIIATIVTRAGISL